MNQHMKKGLLTLKDGTKLEGISFGAETAVAGETVFSTGMVGYPESLTDPSYTGQILISTYPLAGSYGVPDRSYWESGKIHATALIVSTYIDTPSHYSSTKTLSQWLKEQNVPALEIKDTRYLAQKIRDEGAQLGTITFGEEIPFHDPNTDNLVDQVSVKEVQTIGEGSKTIILFDCGVKENTIRHFAKRGIKMVRVPWNYDPFAAGLKFDGIFVSNGPGDPKMATTTIETVKKAIDKNIPIFGICLGNQILALAAGGDTYKLKFGHRGQNQPCRLEGSPRCYLTTQNHGFAVGKIPEGFKQWFSNANDGTNEGIIHESLPFMSVQFHPESAPGPIDTTWLFDYFVERL